MIIKSKKNIEKEGISVHNLYPVIKCKEHIGTGAKEFCIYDDGNFLSWKTVKYFEFENESLENYSKDFCEDYIYYTYNLIDENFFDLFYLENEQSLATRCRLEQIIVNIFSDELSIQTILESIEEIGLKGNSIEFLLKAFFKKASNKDIKYFMHSIYNKVSDLDGYLISLIVDNITVYKEPEIDNILSEIYMNPLCSEETRCIISDYWS